MDIDRVIQNLREAKKKASCPPGFRYSKKMNMCVPTRKYKGKYKGRRGYFIGGGYGAIQVLDIIYKQKMYQPIGYFADDNSILDLIGINRLGKATVEEVKKVDLDLVWEPPWDKSMMSEAAKLELNL